MKKLLRQILEIESESGRCDDMQQFLWDFAEKSGWESRTDKLGNIYMTKGRSESYPCVVAHMDTVHEIIADGKLMAAEVEPGIITGFNSKTKEQSGIGGDDKCGIYAALRAMIALKECKAAFFVDEEVGCHGSGAADIGFFSDCRFILQADRRGGSDWVTNISGPLGSDAFQKAVKPFLKAYGYTPTSGAMSDVMALRDGMVGISCANMSAGYHNPHQTSEWISVPQLENCVSMIIAICLGLKEAFPFQYEACPPAWSFGTRVGGRRAAKSASSYDTYCTYCMEPKYYLEMEDHDVCLRCSVPQEPTSEGITCTSCDSCGNLATVEFVEPFGLLCSACERSMDAARDQEWSQ